jgi:glycosyltransferase involved in cell wall biosynthesis
MKWDLIIIVASRPVPRDLQLADAGAKQGNRVLLLVLERGGDEFLIDRAFQGFCVKTINVSYKGVGIRRIVEYPRIAAAILKILRRELDIDGCVITSSLDLLFLAVIHSLFYKVRIRHEVKDLHALQLDSGTIGRLVSKGEKILLNRVERLILASQGFYDHHYQRIYSGSIAIVENVPSRAAWMGLKKRERSESFEIGFVGIVRYQQSMEQLVSAVKILHGRGHKLRVVFAGGGYIREWIESMESNGGIFEFSGPFEYAKDIKKIYEKLNLIYAVYDGYDANCKVAMPTKFYESIISRTPILVADGTLVANEVRSLGIGTAVGTGDVLALVKILEQAVSYAGWYKRALERLENIDSSHYFDRYESALRLATVK